jgi:hypothetical protein
VYNYGVDSYLPGNDLRYLVVNEDSYKGSPDRIQLSPEGKKIVKMPDGHWLLLSPRNQGGLGIFQCVSLHVANITESVAFYCNALKAHLIQFNTAGDRSAILSFAGPDSVQLELVELPTGVNLDRGEAFGRLAIETEDNAPMKISESISR